MFFCICGYIQEYINKTETQAEEEHLALDNQPPF